MTMKMRIVLIGAGRLATNLGAALRQQGQEIVQVYSRTMASATALAQRLEAAATDSLAAVVTDADVYIVSVKDSALAQLLPELCKGREEGVFLHTAGSMPLSVFDGYARHYGVLYPMQTFSKERLVDFSRVPLFIEGADQHALDMAETLARMVSGEVRQLSSADRRHLHLAAVFACNFANHCYELSAEILERHGIPFSVMLPLIDETAAKVHTMSPREAQTGPAVRFDENVMQAQMQLLAGQEQARHIYEEMSRSIYLTASGLPEK